MHRHQNDRFLVFVESVHRADKRLLFKKFLKRRLIFRFLLEAYDSVVKLLEIVHSRFRLAHFERSDHFRISRLFEHRKIEVRDLHFFRFGLKIPYRLRESDEFFRRP